MRRAIGILMTVLCLCAGAAACDGASLPTTPQPLRVLAVETFLADIAQNVAGERVQVQVLLPIGVDPHGYQPTPGDVARVAECDVLIVNGAGLEAYLDELLQAAGGQHRLIVASQGLASRAPQPGEPLDADHEVDPHFWLDPNNVVRYVENIRDGLSQADAAGAAAYAGNAAAYVAQLRDLDAWIQEQVRLVPPERRLLVTNHESFGYFADRYGFQVVGAIVPSVSTGAAPSARELADLVDRIAASGAPAVFLETGANPQLAQQLSQETGIRVVTGLYTHSVSAAGGEAPSYIEMIRFNTAAIVGALAPR